MKMSRCRVREKTRIYSICGSDFIPRRQFGVLVMSSCSAPHVDTYVRCVLVPPSQISKAIPTRLEK